MIASVIIPTRNRPQCILDCLDALARQTLPAHSFEVIVVDDGSAQPLELSNVPSADRFELRLIRQSNTGPAGARNRGAQEARGEFLAFTDDDCCPEPGWLATLIDALQQNPMALVGGSTVNALKENMGAHVSQMILELVYEHFNADPDEAYFFASNNMACRQDTFKQVGGFDADFPSPAAEDREFCDRWRMKGLPLIWRKDALIKHRHNQSLREFNGLHFRYGIGAFLYQDRRTARNSGTMRQDLSFHRTLPRRTLPHLRGTGIRRGARILAYLIAWQIANACGFFYSWMFSPRSQRPLNLDPFRGYSIIVQRRGGAGNQLFQYAAARQAARDLGATVAFTPTDTKVRATDIQLEAFTGALPAARTRDLLSFLLFPPNTPCWLIEWNRRLRRKLRIGRVVWKLEGGTMEQIERSFWGRRLLFDAYVQNRAHFQAILPDILREIASQKPTGATNTDRIIGVNLRTGDDFAAVGWALPLSYYDEAIEALDTERTHTIWLIGDEPEKLRTLIPHFEKRSRPVMLAPMLTSNRQWDDFWNMARVHKLVMSRSTYCWWAAAMNDYLHQDEPNRIVAPAEWRPAIASNIVPGHWISVASP